MVACSTAVEVSEGPRVSYGRLSDRLPQTTFRRHPTQSTISLVHLLTQVVSCATRLAGHIIRGMQLRAAAQAADGVRIGISRRVPISSNASPPKA
jgi:hypothetical protein